MKTNVGGLDRILRIVAGLALLGAGYSIFSNSMAAPNGLALDPSLRSG